MRQDRVYERSSCTAYVWASHSSKYCSRNATQMKASKLVPSSYRRVIGSPPVPSLPVPLAPPPHAGTSRSATSCLSLQLVLMEIRGCVSQSCAPLRATQTCSGNQGAFTKRRRVTTSSILASAPGSPTSRWHQQVGSFMPVPATCPHGDSGLCQPVLCTIQGKANLFLDSSCPHWHR